MQTTQLYDLYKVANSAKRQINCLLMTPRQSILRETVLQLHAMIESAVILHEKEENEREKKETIPNSNAPIGQTSEIPSNTTEGGENDNA